MQYRYGGQNVYIFKLNEDTKVGWTVVQAFQEGHEYDNNPYDYVATYENQSYQSAFAACSNLYGFDLLLVDEFDYLVPVKIVDATVTGANMDDYIVTVTLKEYEREV